MAKPSLTEVNTSSDTFQSWIDITNEIVSVIKTDAITASISGDSTTGNATLIGVFTADTITATTTLKSDTISSRTTGGPITANSRLNISSTAAQQLQTLTNTNGPRTRYSTGASTWDVGYKDGTSNDFVIDSSQDGGTVTFRLTTDGNVFIPGTVTADTFSGVVAGTVSSLSNFTTDDLDEGATNQYYSPLRVFGDARLALSVQDPSRGLTYDPSTGIFGLTQDLRFNASPSFKAINFHGFDDLSTPRDAKIYATASGDDSLVISKGGEDVILITNNAGVNSTNILGLAHIKDHPTDTASLGNLIVSSANANQGTIIATGDITAFGSVSDIRKKENIEPITDALEKISKIGGYTFNYYNDERRMAGVIAQELLEVLPEVVYETEDPENNSTRYAVRHGNIVGLLIEAIKELKAEVEELKNK